MEDLSDDFKAANIGSASTSGIPSYEADAEGGEREDNNGKTDDNSKSRQYGGDLSASSRTLMISGIPSTFCTKEFLQRHFQVRRYLYSCNEYIGL